MKNPFKIFYDPLTDKIYGCKKGTLLWYHEDRHRQQFKKGQVALWQMWGYYALILAVAFSIVEKEPKIFSYFCLGIIALSILRLEIDAWIYAIKKKIIK